MQPKESGIAIATTSASGVTECSDSNIIPNMFHTLNTTLTFDEDVDWLGTSDEVVNFWMFFEGIWTWMRANEGSPVKCSPNLLNKFREIRKKRKWREVSKSFLNLILHKSESSREFFQAIMSCEDLCIGIREAGWNILLNKGEIKDIFSVFEQETKLYFICEGHNIMSNCTKPGKCGFVLKQYLLKSMLISFSLLTPMITQRKYIIITRYMLKICISKWNGLKN